MQPSKAIIAAGVLMVGLTLAESVRHPSQFVNGGLYKRLWAIGATMLLLTLAADFAPEVAVPLAVLIAVAFTVRYSGAFTDVASGRAAATAGGPPGLVGPRGKEQESRPPGVRGPIG